MLKKEESLWLSRIEARNDGESFAYTLRTMSSLPCHRSDDAGQKFNLRRKFSKSFYDKRHPIKVFEHLIWCAFTFLPSLFIFNLKAVLWAVWNQLSSLLFDFRWLLDGFNSEIISKSNISFISSSQLNKTFCLLVSSFFWKFQGNT